MHLDLQEPAGVTPCYADSGPKKNGACGLLRRTPLSLTGVATGLGCPPSRRANARHRSGNLAVPGSALSDSGGPWALRQMYCRGRASFCRPPKNRCFHHAGARFAPLWGGSARRCTTCPVTVAQRLHQHGPCRLRPMPGMPRPSGSAGRGQKKGALRRPEERRSCVRTAIRSSRSASRPPRQCGCCGPSPFCAWRDRHRPRSGRAAASACPWRVPPPCAR